MADTATLTPADLRSRLSDPKVRLLDVRSPGEFAAGRIPGSHNIPLGDLSTTPRSWSMVRSPSSCSSASPVAARVWPLRCSPTPATTATSCSPAV